MLLISVLLLMSLLTNHIIPSELVSALLNYDPAKRPSAQQILGMLALFVFVFVFAKGILSPCIHAYTCPIRCACSMLTTCLSLSLISTLPC